MENMNRKCGIDEKRQLETIEKTVLDIEKKYNKTLKAELDDFTKTSRGTESRYFTKDGDLVYACDRPRNKYEDTKTMDCVVYFEGKEKKRLAVYFFCKHTEGCGGAQDGINFEIEITKRNVQNNKIDSITVAFMLDGSYWENADISEMGLDGTKTFYTTSETLNQNLTKILKKNNLI